MMSEEGLFAEDYSNFYIFFFSFFLRQIERGKYQHLHYGKFKAFLNHKLNVSYVLDTINVDDYIECAFDCIINIACFSFNIAILPDINSNRHVCHLLATDKYNHYQSFMSSHNFHHYTVTVGGLDRSLS